MLDWSINPKSDCLSASPLSRLRSKPPSCLTWMWPLTVLPASTITPLLVCSQHRSAVEPIKCHHQSDHIIPLLKTCQWLPPHLEQKLKSWTPLVVQWLRIHLPTQGTWVCSLVQVDPTCLGAIKPVCWNYWACVLEPACFNKRRNCNEKPGHCN